MAERLSIVRDPKTQSAIVSTLKRCFSRSPTVIDFLKKHRRTEQWFKKDGSKAKTPKVFYKCSQCGKEFNSNNVQVDHINPVVPLNIPAKHMSYNVLISRLFCGDDGLQILCKQHHKEKSQLENAIRKEWLSKVKYVVYETTNRINGKRYIGVHKCDDYDDYYIGSGIALKQALKKYGADNFHRIIVDAFDNANDAYELEKKLVNADIVESDDYYNIALGGRGDPPVNNEHLKVKVICHETGQIFSSINDAAKGNGICHSTISRVINSPDSTANGYHFFTLDAYEPSRPVFYPPLGRRVIHLNRRKQYESLKEAADSLSINYKSLRNITSDGVFSLNDDYFIYADEYDHNKKYQIPYRTVVCVELQKSFKNLQAAAKFINRKKTDIGMAAIAIGKSARSGRKMYGYTWQYRYETLEL